MLNPLRITAYNSQTRLCFDLYALVGDFSQWLPWKHMPLLLIVYAAGFGSVSNVPQSLTGCHAWLVGTKQVQKNYRRNGQSDDVVEELAGRNTVNEWPILCNFFSNNNLPLSLVDPQKVERSILYFLCCSNFQKSTLYDVTKSMTLLPG